MTRRPHSAAVFIFRESRLKRRPLLFLLLQINVFHILDRVAEETGAEAAEFLHGVGGEKLHAGMVTAFDPGLCCERMMGKPVGNRMRCGLCGVDNRHVGGRALT